MLFEEVRALSGQSFEKADALSSTSLDFLTTSFCSAHQTFSSANCAKGRSWRSGPLPGKVLPRSTPSGTLQLVFPLSMTPTTRCDTPHSPNLRSGTCSVLLFHKVILLHTKQCTKLCVCGVVRAQHLSLTVMIGCVWSGTCSILVFHKVSLLHTKHSDNRLCLCAEWYMLSTCLS